MGRFLIDLFSLGSAIKIVVHSSLVLRDNIEIEGLGLST